MKSLTVMIVGSVLMLASGVSSAHNGGMMNDGGWMGGYGGYGGYWGPILVIVVVGVVVWAILQKRK